MNGVTPFAGVWIEIPSKLNNKALCTSLPSRECGLKSSTISIILNCSVTPFAGVWIELLLGCQKYSHQISCGVADRCVSNIQGIE